jgi:hypothetical protein
MPQLTLTGEHLLALSHAMFLGILLGFGLQTIRHGPKYVTSLNTHLQRITRLPYRGTNAGGRPVVDPLKLDKGNSPSCVT